MYSATIEPSLACRNELGQRTTADTAERGSPLHSKYRKLLDPLFAPKRMDEQEDDIGRRIALIDGFIEAGECGFTEDFAEIFPSSVFLGLMGLPEEELRMFLRLRDGSAPREDHPRRARRS